MTRKFHKIEEEEKDIMRSREQWVELYEKVTEKVVAHLTKFEEGFPNIIRYDTDKYNQEGATSWISGFWPGMVLLAYKATKDEKILAELRKLEERQNVAFTKMLKLHHDVGFMWYITSAEDYNFTGNEEARDYAVAAALFLMSRFNPKGNFLRAWNDDGKNDSVLKGRAIIDCMINIELLYWASEVTGDPRFKNVADAHADSSMKNFIREDGTIKHIVEYDPVTGEYVKNVTGQSYDEKSCWTRGMGWAAYGFIKAYARTKNEEYLKTSQKVIDTWLRLLPEGEVPPCDFMQPAEPMYYDSSAGAIVACAMLDNAVLCPEKKEFYVEEAKKLLSTLTDKCADLDIANDGILRLASQAYHKGQQNITLIYGDYYYYEALEKLMKLL